MPPVMLILGTTPSSQSLAERAVDEARRTRQSLVIVAVLDHVGSDKVASQLAESGQIGPRPSAGVVDSLQTRREQQILEQAQEIARRAAAVDVDSRAIVKREDYATAVSTAIHDERPDTLIVARKPRQFLRLRSEDGFLETLQARLGFRLLEL